MAERELKRLSRRELLEMLIAQGRENERLQAEITRLEELLSEREIHLARSGNIAEAALRLNGLFEAAQRAAEQYLENLSRGEIARALVGESGEFILLDAKGNAILPGQVWDDTDLSDPDPEAAEAAAAEEKPGKPKKAKKPKQPKEPKEARPPKKPKQPKQARPPKMPKPVRKPIRFRVRFPFPLLRAKLKALIKRNG